ncbi:hypothetical protein VB774_02090 [Pseudanabaena galeata UHCC 0370]|uniref:Uncharacterized protein n=1 Tax=Pseudanabaena galeata UHCC 0370 TaxID=3110310 RepID=A0ABU5TDP4_9CYAN|nr:hypothetical protein [Pseudanabaena galeata]MEA5476399.1 hypothetical protein [Pseudanabaena galeata UHCC 0370]
MTENIEIPFEANKDGDIPEDLPLGNYTPLLVPPSLGQSFLQPKFIYPLGAISLVNPDNLAAENDFEQLNNTFNDSPFFDQPLQSDSLGRVDSQATNQPNIQTKTIASKNNPQRQVQTERSPIDSPKSTSIQRKTVGSSQAQPLNSPLNLSSQELSANPSPNYDFQPSLDADTSENIDIQRSDDLSIIDSTNSNSDRPEQIQRTSDRSSANTPNPRLPLNSNSPVLETSIEQSNQSNPDKPVQRQIDEANLAFANNNLLEGDRSNQTESNLFAVDTTQSLQTDVVQRQSEISNVDNITQSEDLQQNYSEIDLPNPAVNLTSDNFQQIQRFPVADNISQSDHFEKIPRTSDGTTTNIQNPQVQLNSNLPVTGINKVSGFLAGDRTIQRASNLIDNDNIPQVSQVPQVAALQGQTNTAPINNPVNNISQVDLTQPIQRQPDLSISNSRISTDKNTQPIQRSSESSILDNVTESDRTIQREPDLSSVDRIQTTQTDEIQRQPDVSSVDSISQGDLTQQIQGQTDLSNSENTVVSNNTQQIQRFAESPILDRVAESDRALQRESLGSVADLTQSDEVQSQTDVDRISQGGYTPQIQRQSDLATADSSIDSSNSTTSNIQPIQRSSEPSIANNFIESDRPIQQLSTLSNIDISQSPPTTSIQRQADQTNIADLSDSDSSSTSNNSQQIQNSLESGILKNASEGDLPIQRKSDLASSVFSSVDRAMTPTDEIQRQPDVSVVDNISESDRSQPIQRQPALSIPDSTSTNNNIQPIAKTSESPILDNIDQDDRTIQREPDLFNNVDIAQAPQTDHLQQFDVAAIESTSQNNTIQREPDLSPVDIKQNAQMNEVQKQTELNPIDSPFQGDRTIQQASNSLAKDVTQVSQPDPLQQQSESLVLDSLSESDHSQLIQTKPDVSTSDSSSNRNSPQQRFGDADISTVDSISGDIQRKSNLSPDLTQTPRTDDVSTVDNISQGNHTIQKKFNISDDDVSRSAQTDYIQRKADASVNGINQESPAQQIQQTDALITDNATASNDIQQIQREVDLSPPYISENAQINEVQRQPDLNLLDSPIQSDRTIQKASELSPIDSMQILHTDEIQRQPDTLEVNSIAESDRPIQRESDLSSADSTQISQVENIQRQPDISTPDISTVDNSSSGDNRTQQIQTKSDLSNSDISTNIDSQQIQRLVDADISPVGSISDTLQQESDISAVDTISQGDRTIQRNPDVFNNVDITQSPQSNDIQRQSDASLNSLIEGNVSQQIQQTDPPISDSNAGENIVQPLQTNFSNVDSNVDIQQNTRSDELQRQSDISTVDNNIAGDNNTQQIQRTSDLSNSNSDASSNTQQIATAIESPLDSLSEDNSSQQIQTKSDLSTADISINRESQQIQRFVDADISDADINSENIQRKTNSSPVELTQFQFDIPQRQPDIVLADNTSPTEQNIQRETDLFNNIDSLQTSQTNDNQETSNLPVDAAEIISQGNLAPQTQPTNLSIADRTFTSNSAQSIQRESLVHNTSQSDRNISSEPAISALDVKQDSQASEIQRQPNISDVDRIAKSDRLTIQNNSDLPPADITQTPQTEGIQRQSDESPVLDSRAESERPQQIQTKPDLSTSNISTNSDSQQIQRFGDADISNVGSIADAIPQSSDISASDISAVDLISQSDRTVQREPELSNNVDSISGGNPISNPVESIQRESLVDNISQSDRNISSEPAISALDVKQDSQTSEIQRQPNISDVDRIAKSDRLTIQNNSDLPPADSTQPPQVDGIQRQSDESPVLDSRAERDHPQQIQTKPDLSTSNISINRESQQIQRFGDADIPVDIDIASDLSPVDITQSSPTNEIQRLSSIAVDDITQGDLTQQTQKTDSSTDSSVDAIQRQSDVSMTDISQSNYTPQRESNGATVIKNDITSSPQNEAIQRQFDPDISTVDNVYQNNSVIQRESDLSVIDTTQASITNDAQSKLQREIVDSTIDNISQVDRIQPVQRNLDYSESSNVDSTLTVDRPNVIQRDTDLVALETEVSSQTSENLDHENQQQIQKKNDQEKENTTNNQTSVEQNTNQTILQMLADPSNTKDLQLPKTIENLAHTDYLGNFSLLPSLQIPSPITSQTVQRSPTDRQDRSTQSSLPNSLNNFAKTIQPMQDKNADNSNSQTSSMGWSNISELLANLPPPPKASSSTSSLNKQTSSTSDRSPLASPSSPSTSSTSNQTTIQRSADSPPSDNDQDLYLTPTGLQKGNPNKITNTRSNTIQRELTSDTLPEAQVSVNTSQNNHSYNAENFAENLETLAQEIYILLKHRLETEKERQGTRYQGRLPW